MATAAQVQRGYQVFDTGEQIDPDTGEVITPYIKPPKVTNYDDGETGEQTQKRLVYQRSKFKVPRSALKLPVFETAVHDSSKKSSTEYISNATLLFLPLLMVLPGWALFAYIMVEMLYHNYSHRKGIVVCNTPLQIIFHHKCAECVAQRQMQTVGKLQDARMLKSNSRRILNCDYAQFGLSS